MFGETLGTVPTDADDIAILNSGFDFRHFSLWDMIGRSACDPVFDLAHFRYEPWIIPEISGGAPIFAHFIQIATLHWGSAQGSGQMHDQTAALVVIDPILEIVQS